MSLLYSFAISLYVLLVRIASLRSEKAKRWLQGRKNWEVHLRNNRPTQKQILWMHCASLGEFEQGRPILEQVKKEFPDVGIVLTFFSPSGFEVRKNYSGADLVMYLPADTLGNARKFLSILKPNLAVFVKYEFWAGYLSELMRLSIPGVLVAARFRQNQFLFSPLGGWLRSKLKAFQTIHVQDQSSLECLQKAGFSDVILSGDTRYDRVFANAENPAPQPKIEAWITGRKTLVAGSSWPSEEELILPWEHSDWALIVVPHEIGAAHLEEIEARCQGKSLRYSELNQEPDQTSSILIVDTVGMLMSIYRLADLAFVGGGFRGSLHNILEPAAMGIPVIYGPNTKKFPEGKALEKAGGGFRIDSKSTFNAQFRALQDESLRKESGRQSFEFVVQQLGATEIILQDIRKLLVA